MFKSRAQICECGMRIEKVDINMFDIRLKVNNQWWVEACFIPFQDWFRKQRS